MPSFAVSIVFLSLVQAAVITLPGTPRGGLLDRMRSRWWALVPPASIVVVIALVALYASSADALSYLALVAVPPLAAVALGAVMRGARPLLALAVAPLFALAWAASGSLGGETAALALSALACVTLGVVLAAVVAPRWLRWGVYAMAAVDTVLVVANLLQGPNSTLVAAGPPAGLPRLQAVYFGSATMGFGDLFIAATVGALLARDRSVQLQAAVLAAILGLGFDLLFLAVDLLPTTVPIAVTLAVIQARDRRRASRLEPATAPYAARSAARAAGTAGGGDTAPAPAALEPGRWGSASRRP
jgi:uncharacterized integral membrane protein